MPIYLNNMENEMKMVSNGIKNLTKQVESISGKLTPPPTGIKVVLLPLSTEKDKASTSDSKMPKLEDDPLPLAIKKTELASPPMKKHDKCLAKGEEILK